MSPRSNRVRISTPWAGDSHRVTAGGTRLSVLLSAPSTGRRGQPSNSYRAAAEPTSSPESSYVGSAARRRCAWWNHARRRRVHGDSRRGRGGVRRAKAREAALGPSEAEPLRGGRARCAYGTARPVGRVLESISRRSHAPERATIARLRRARSTYRKHVRSVGYGRTLFRSPMPQPARLDGAPRRCAPPGAHAGTHAPRTVCAHGAPRVLEPN